MDREQYRIISSPQKNDPKKKRNIGLRISSDSTPGGRKYQEDTILIAFERKDDADYACLCVFDGHGGPQASTYARDNLWENIKKQNGFFSRHNDTVMKAIREGFLFTQSEMWNARANWPDTASGYPSTAGTTVSMSIICGKDMYIAHVGDSRIAIGRQTDKGMEADVLTRDHKPSLPRERDRIAKAGGKVQNKAGTDRVVWTRTKNNHEGPVRRSTTTFEIPFLAVSRSLGDLWSYNYDSCEYVVSPEPEIWHHTIDPNKERFLILASDGLWNVASVYDCINMVDTYSTTRLHNNGLMKETISHKLVKRGMDLWNYRLLRADNITVITCFFEFPDTLDDEGDQLDMDSIRDWEEAGLKFNGPYPEGMSPFKPPLRRIQACPKLRSLENYNSDFCVSAKQKKKYRYKYFADFGCRTDWPSNSYFCNYPRVKTCNCASIKNGDNEIRQRGSRYTGCMKSVNKVMYASSSTCAHKRSVENSLKNTVVKRLKLDSNTSTEQCRPLVAASPESRLGETSLSGNIGSKNKYSFEESSRSCTFREKGALDNKPRDSTNSLSEDQCLESESSQENLGIVTSPQTRKTPRRSPRIQAAAFIIPKSRRSCTIR